MGLGWSGRSRGSPPTCPVALATADVRRVAKEGHVRPRTLSVRTHEVYGLLWGHILLSVLRTRVSSRSSSCKGFGPRLRRAPCRHRIWANPVGEEPCAGSLGVRGETWLAGPPVPRKGLPEGRENGRGLRPPSERGPKSSGLCPFVVLVAEVDRRHLASNKLSRAPQKGNAARVNGGLVRNCSAHRVGLLRAKT